MTPNADYGTPDEELARRACLVIRAMLSDCARHLCRTDLAELNAVMYEAERRGWYRASLKRDDLPSIAAKGNAGV